MTHMLCSLAGGKVVVALEVRGRANLGRFLKLTGLYRVATAYRPLRLRL